MTSTTRLFSVAAAVLAFTAHNASAQQLFAVSGSPLPMVINAAVAGAQPTADVDMLTTYTLVGKFKQYDVITAQISSPMPAGVTLSVQLEAPGAATSLGMVALSTTARQVVTNLGNKINETNSITYQLSATVAAGVVPLQSRTVTFTLVNMP